METNIIHIFETKLTAKNYVFIQFVGRGSFCKKYHKRYFSVKQHLAQKFEITVRYHVLGNWDLNIAHMLVFGLPKKKLHALKTTWKKIKVGLILDQCNALKK